MWDTVLQILITLGDEAEGTVHPGQMGLRVDPTRMCSHLGEGSVDEPGAQPPTTMGPIGAHPADPVDQRAVGIHRIGEQSQGRVHTVLVTDPELTCPGFQVTAVEIRVRAGLFDHEHVATQPQNAVQRRRVEIDGPGTPESAGPSVCW